MLTMIYLFSALLIAFGAIPLFINIQGIYVIFFAISYLIIGLIGVKLINKRYNKTVNDLASLLKQLNTNNDKFDSSILSLSGLLAREFNPLYEELEAINKIKIDLCNKLNECQEREILATQNSMATTENLQQCSTNYEFLDNNITKVSTKTQAITNNLTDEIRTLAQLVASVDNGVKIQLFKLRETKANMSNITHSIDGIADNTNIASDGASISREAALIGAKEVLAIISHIESVKDTVLLLKTTMQSLSEKAENISHVMNVIKEVADQTNLLALNAAIEAARAGEAGKGFSVVASEVRKLAEKTMNATHEVETAVKVIQEETAINIEAVNTAAGFALEGVKYAASAGEFMNNIVDRLNETADQLNKIAVETASQSESSKETDSALAEIESVAETTAVHILAFTSAILNISNNMDQVDTIVRVMRNGDIEAVLENTLIKWSPAYEVGIPIIDAQHQMLCLYINGLHRFIQEKRDKSELHKLVASLKDYTVTHFNTEEQYFSRSEYPHTKAHKELHAKFIAKIVDVEIKLKNGSLDVGSDLLDFLKSWLLDHINGTDKKYVSYVLKSMAQLEGQV